MARQDWVLGHARVVPHLVGGWSDHAASWLRQDRIPCLILRYEDMLEDTAGCLARMARFIGVEASACEVAEAVAASSFASLQQQERESGFAERMDGQARFFREGRQGQWKQALSPRQIALIERDHADMMLCFGYDLASAPVAPGQGPAQR
jgi:hypothetical protein